MDKNKEPLNKKQQLAANELKKIGAKLRKLRKGMGYTGPDKFAYEHDLNRSQYGKYEAGTEDMRLSSLINILAKFNLTLCEFFGEDYD